MKKFLTNGEEKSFVRAVQGMQRRDGVIILRHNNDICCHLSACLHLKKTYFLKLAGILCLFMLPTVSST